MKNTIRTLALIAGLAMSSATPATIIQGNGLHDAMWAAGARNFDVHTDQIGYERWMASSIGFAGTRLLFELAGFANDNAFGIYDVTDSANRLMIFSGAAGVNSRGLLANEGNEFCVWGSILDCSSFGSGVFGFYLDTPLGTLFSESQLNPFGIDHMIPYEGGDDRGNIGGRPWLENEYILAWEDQIGGGDRDYNDFGVLVGPIVAVAEPASLALFGIAALMLIVYGRRRIRVRGR